MNYKSFTSFATGIGVTVVVVEATVVVIKIKDENKPSNY